MIKMEIRMDEHKIKESSQYTVEQICSMIDEVAKAEGITQKDRKGLFRGNNDNEDFSNFGIIVLYLKDREWFLPFVEKWILYVGDERDDLAKHYKRKMKVG